MPIQHIKPPKGSDIVMQRLQELIRTGEYAPGSKLPTVVELAASFEVGRSTIREALSGLKATGWITIRHGCGTFVAGTLPGAGADAPDSGAGLSLPTESLQEVLEVRTCLEAGCAALAAKRRSPELMAQLEHIVREMEEALGDEKRSEEADVCFHVHIARASGNQLMAEMMESLTEKLQENMRYSRRLWFFAGRAAGELLLQAHRDIAAAIRDGDAALAAERMTAHLSKVEAELRERFVHPNG
jgi:GntR family transcriptional repressor for pyruvate dehydrogenase complex